MKFMPWILAMPPNNSQDLPIAAALMTGAPVASFLALYSTLAASAIFTIIALWVFQRQELWKSNHCHAGSLLSQLSAL